MTLESRSIAIIDPGASCEAASEPEGPEIPEDREKLAGSAFYNQF